MIIEFWPSRRGTRIAVLVNKALLSHGLTTIDLDEVGADLDAGTDLSPGRTS